jgi:hypothetical protein
MPPIRPSSTATSGGPWGDEVVESRIPNDAGESTLKQMYAWVDPDGDPDKKSSYKFPHHKTSADGTVGAANLAACSGKIGELNGAHGNYPDIPDADFQGVWDHLAKHLRDAGREPPELKSRSANSTQAGTTSHATSHAPQHAVETSLPAAQPALPPVDATPTPDQQDAGGTQPATPETGPDGSRLPSGWRGRLAPLDSFSGDRRMIVSPPGGELRTRPYPMLLLYQPTLEDEHRGSYAVGKITRAWIEGGFLWGEGTFDLADPQAADVAAKLGRGMAGWVSVDLDDTTFETLCYQDGQPVDCETAIEEMDLGDGWVVFEVPEGLVMVDAAVDWRLMTATLVTQPAFPEAKIEPVYDMPQDMPTNGSQPVGAGTAPVAASVRSTSVVTAHYGAVGDAGLPWAARDHAWDSAAAAQRVADWAKDGSGTIDPTKYSRAFLWRDPGKPPTNTNAYKLGFADIVDGQLRAVLRGVFAAAAARGRTSIPDSEMSGVKAKLTALYWAAAREFNDPNITPPWEDSSANSLAPAAGGTITTRPVAAVVAGGGPAAPPAGWFHDPKLTEPTPLTITDDGRVYGHLATWGTCHIGITGRCVTPPHSGSGYSLFRTGLVRTAEGTDVPVGTIVAGTTHADLTAGLADTMSHYAHTGSAVATVTAGEDEYGIWVAGSLLPGLTDEQEALLRRSPLSGDWRTVGGQLELVAALAVNVPGFPIPRSRTGDEGRPLSMVAAGALPRRLRVRRTPGLTPQLSPGLAAEQVARRVVELMGEQRDEAARARRAEEVAARVRNTRVKLLAQRVGRAAERAGKGA